MMSLEVALWMLKLPGPDVAVDLLPLRAKQGHMDLLEFLENVSPLI